MSAELAQQLRTTFDELSNDFAAELFEEADTELAIQNARSRVANFDDLQREKFKDVLKLICKFKDY